MITQYALRNKNLTPLLLTILCACCALTTSVHAQAVHIPDPNLRQAVSEALNLPVGGPITEANMRQLTSLDVAARQITDLTGLENATSLTDLRLGENPIRDISRLAHLTQLRRLDLDRNFIADVGPLAGLTALETLDLRYNQIEDLRPLANLTQLTRLFLANNKIEDLSPLTNLTQLTGLLLDNNRIEDVSPLAGLTELESLNLCYNQIEDVSPLAALTQLTRLVANHNQIKDVRPLASLTRLEVLYIQWNNIIDHSPLEVLPLVDFRYDQVCVMEPLPLEPRLANQNYPRVPGGDWVVGHDPRLDLLFGGLFQMHPRADGRLTGDVERALKERDEYIAANPNAVFLVGIIMRRARIDYWPKKSPYWVRDSAGNFVLDGGQPLVDFTHPEVQDIIVQQAISVSKCGLFDGIIFDHWRDEHDMLQGYKPIQEQLQARLNILRRIRAVTRPNFLIQVNPNYFTAPHTGRYINGLSMETGIPNWGSTPEERERILTEVEKTITWAEATLREPRINAIFGGGPRVANEQWVRLVTTLSLTHADGYATVQHLDLPMGDEGHWYDFWDADLGQPVGAKRQLHQETEGLYIREFTNGWAVYNHSGSPQVITLPEEVQGVASELVGREHTLPNLDGEMYLRVKPANPADVNGDGVVNIFDLTLVAQAIGTDGAGGDVNGDGVVNVFDLVFVANQF